ncbi:MAG TPA: efflux RND transporter periplasmic adaptor subunit [Burkholderiales bacterium]|nr:efflux RND transporter periplasmic adaptor subunit [Burkholderiales bacterium]
MRRLTAVQRADAAEAAGAGLAQRETMHRARTRMFWRLLIGALLLVTIAGGVAYWATRDGKPVQYATAALTRGTVERAVSSSGTVNPVLTIIVGSYISGVIVHQYCDYNTQVKKGQLCAQIDPRPYQTAVDQAQADLGTAQAQLNKDRASLAYQKVSYERDVGLLKRGIVSQDTLDNAKSAYDQAQAQVELDQATIRQHEAALKAARINLEYTDIRSPVSGTVVSRNITIGQTVAASFQTPTLFLIATDLTQMQVDTNVSETDIGGVKEGNRATFTVEAFPGRPFEGKVVQVRQAPQTVQNVVTYDVVIAVDNKALLLKPGMTATARIVVARRDDVLRVPDQALRFAPRAQPASQGSAKPAASATGAAVWVLRDGQPTRVPLKTGLDDDAYTEVSEGVLAAGDEVIIGERRSAAAQPSLWPRLFGR